MPDNLINADRVLSEAKDRAEKVYNGLKEFAERIGYDTSLFDDPKYRETAIGYLNGNIVEAQLGEVKKASDILFKPVSR